MTEVELRNTVAKIMNEWKAAGLKESDGSHIRLRLMYVHQLRGIPGLSGGKAKLAAYEGDTRSFPLCRASSQRAE